MVVDALRLYCVGKCFALKVAEDAGVMEGKAKKETKRKKWTQEFFISPTNNEYALKKM